MPYALANFNTHLKLEINKGYYAAVGAANLTAALTAMSTAVGAETKTHSLPIQPYITATLHPSKAPDRWQGNMNLIINKGFAGNLTAAQMAASLTTFSAGPFPLALP